MRFVAITDKAGATLNVEFGGQHAQRPMESIDVDEFIGIKSHRAKGKRITTYDVDKLTFVEPEVADMLEDEDDVADDELIDMDELMGDEIQMNPNVDYKQYVDKEEADISVSQLNLF
jgi:topoisomerase-4 subunit A